MLSHAVTNHQLVTAFSVFKCSPLTATTAATARYYCLLLLTRSTAQLYCDDVNAVDNFRSSILSYACSTVEHVNSVTAGVDPDPNNHTAASEELLLDRVEAARVFIASCTEKPTSKEAAEAAAGRAALNINAVDNSCKGPLYWSVIVSNTVWFDSLCQC
jgi:hypothetical protein